MSDEQSQIEELKQLAIDMRNQRDQLAQALSSIIRFAELYEPKHKCVRDDLSLTIATAKNALKLAKGGGK